MDSFNRSDRLVIICWGRLSEVQEITVLLLTAGIDAESVRGDDTENDSSASGQNFGQAEGYDRTDLWYVVIGERNLKRAYDIITGYRRDADIHTIHPPVLPQIILPGQTNRATFVITFLLFFFFLVAGPFSRGGSLFEAGAVIRSRVLHGELWRVLTALTLHGSLSHVLGNMVALVVFGNGVCQILGVGRGWLVILAAGAAGNLLKVYLHSYEYYSIGASTSVFGAVGLLGGLVYQIEKFRKQRNAWISLAASVALLGFLGGSKDADILAHFYGFISGLTFSFYCSRLKKQNDKDDIKYLAVAAVLILTSWLLAIFT